MLKQVALSTKAHTELIDITAAVANAVKESKVKDGVCFVFVPHTTAGVTINENADPSVRTDITAGLGRMAPLDANYAHAEGNSAAHIQSTIVGTDKTIFIENGSLKLGTWQGIFFCEFDGPRHRNFSIKITEG